MSLLTSGTDPLTTTEVWRSVPSVEYLEASSWGRVRALPYEVPMPHGGKRKYEMAPTYGVEVWPSPNYRRMQVTFRRKTYKIHRLVAEAFHGPLPEGLDVSHEDEDATNNVPHNLIFETRKANLNRPKIKAYHRSVCRAKMESMSEA